MSLTWGDGKSEETVITTTMIPGLFERGDKIEVSGLVYTDSNGLFVVRRAKGTQCFIEPAGWRDYVTHYAKKFWNEAQWKFWGAVNSLEDTRKRLRRK